MDIDHNFHKKLLALGIYLTALKVTFLLGYQPWGAKVVGPDGYRVWAAGPGVWAQGYDVEIFAKNSQTSPALPTLTSDDLITGLWETMVQISQYNFYYEATLTIKDYYQDVGTLKIQEHAVGATANGTKVDADAFLNPVGPSDAALSLAQAAPLNSTGPLSIAASRLPIPGSDHRYAVTFKFGGKQIQSKDVFMVALGILATTAQDDPRSKLTKELDQTSPSKKCRLRLRHVGNSNETKVGAINAALFFVVTKIMVQLERFETMGFAVWFLQTKIAEGIIYIPPALEDGGAVEES